MAVTAKDVARRAGVSVSTVSRALSRPDLVALDTRRAVDRAARELDYRPNPAARGLITGRTGNLGLVLPDLENPFFASLAKGVQARARASGYAVFVADTEEDPRLETDLVHQLAPQVDGLLLCSPRTTEEQLAALAARAVVVLVNRRSGDLPAVTQDNADGVRQVVAHLRALGHRHIAYAGGLPTSWSDGERRAGLEAARDRFGDVEITDLGHFRPDRSGGLQAADLALACGASAVLAYNDLMALGLGERLAVRRVDVPERMSLVGFDDIPLASMITPPLTTVATAPAALGRAAVDRLIALLEGTPSPGSEDPLPVELMVRRSTAEAPRVAGKT